MYLLTLFPNSVRGPNAVGEEHDLPMAKNLDRVSDYLHDSFNECHRLCSVQPSTLQDYAGKTALSHPIPSYRYAQDIVLRFVYHQMEIYLIRHSKQQSVGVLLWPGTFRGHADEDPLIEALKRQVQASQDGRKMRRTGQRLGNFHWDKRVGWRGRERGNYRCRRLGW